MAGLASGVAVYGSGVSVVTVAVSTASVLVGKAVSIDGVAREASEQLTNKNAMRPNEMFIL